MSKTSTSDEIWKILKEIALNQKKWEKWEKKRAEAEAQREKKRAEAEAQQEKKRAEEKARQDKEWAEWKKKDQKKIEEIRILQKEAEIESKKTEKLIHKVIGDSGNRWGKLGENLVKGQLAQRLKERGIKVERVITNAKGPFSEFDLIAINGKEVVVVEVKATLDPSDVNKFEENIKNFKTWWPEFKNKTLYGGMAFLIKSNRQADSLAQKRGFFVIEATGDVIFQNEKDFEPRVFS